LHKRVVYTGEYTAQELPGSMHFATAEFALGESCGVRY